MVFPVVMCGCESWTIKKAECLRIDAFKLCCWRRLLRVPWTARRSNQSILKKISPEYSFEGLMLKLKLQYLGHLMWRIDSLEKTLMLGKIEGRRKREPSFTVPGHVNSSSYCREQYAAAAAAAAKLLQSCPTLCDKNTDNSSKNWK